MAKYISSTITTGTYCRARLVVEHTPNNTEGYSDIKAYVEMWRTNSGYTTSGTGTLSIGIEGYGTVNSDILSSQKITYNSYTRVGSIRTAKITHNTDGTFSAKFTVKATSGVDNISFEQKTFTVALTPIPVYTLKISQGTGSKIVVNRTLCTGNGNTGVLSPGEKKLCKGDKLKITFSADTNYKMQTNTVNNSTFVSGNTHTVSGNVSVASSASMLMSTIGATDANIGSTAMITVNQSNASHTHTITYEFFNETGTICTKSSDTVIPWVVPESFYEQIPNMSAGICTLTITTYNGDTLVGSDSCTIWVYVPKNDSIMPSIIASVVDTNETTIALTGDSSVLVRYASNALCTIHAEGKKFATVGMVAINGARTDSNEATVLINSVSSSSFSFFAVDSRGNISSDEITPNIIPYIPLTCNPTITRPIAGGNSMVMSCSGNLYTGSFGSAINKLTIQYRYKEVGADESQYSSWKPISDEGITYGVSSYRIDSVSLDDDFDYRKGYIFEVMAIDGANGVQLSVVPVTIPVSRGIPIYDWGEDDFNINVQLKLNNVNILDIIYPIGAIYIHSNNSLPDVISNIGKWESVSSSMTGMYIWKRTS